ncbi:hypothetical protein [Glycomyces sp. NPDC021274]|uniref:hypothetical protein n=1 Tax=Glycomyces sp. NPDC021274 TaxID=3155120 RepID=UPI0033EFD26D
MQREELLREQVKAMIFNEPARSTELRTQIGEQGLARAHFNFTTAVFAGAVIQYFGEELDLAALRTFMTGIRHDFRKADPPLKFMTVEGAVRAIYGEDHFLDEMTGEEQLIAMSAVIRKITFETPYITDNIEPFLDEAEKLARQWESEG